MQLPHHQFARLSDTLANFKVLHFKIRAIATDDYAIYGSVLDPFHRGFGKHLADADCAAFSAIYNAKHQAYKPYVLSVPAYVDRMRQGEKFEFELRLFNDAITFSEAIYHALIAWQTEGILGGGKASFFIQSIDCVTASGRRMLVYLQGHKPLILPQPYSLKDKLTCSHVGQQGDLVLVATETPMLLKVSGKPIQSAPTAQQLVSAIARRIAALSTEISDHERDELELLRKSDNDDVVLVAQGVSYTLDQRRSHSSKQLYHPYGGLFGGWSYGGNIGWLEPWLCLAEAMHVGGKTSFGFGQIVWSKGKTGG